MEETDEKYKMEDVEDTEHEKIDYEDYTEDLDIMTDVKDMCDVKDMKVIEVIDDILILVSVKSLSSRLRTLLEHVLYVRRETNVNQHTILVWVGSRPNAPGKIFPEKSHRTISRSFKKPS